MRAAIHTIRRYGSVIAVLSAVATASAVGNYKRHDFRRLIEQREAALADCYRPLLVFAKGEHWPYPGRGMLDRFVQLEDHWKTVLLDQSLAAANALPDPAARDDLVQRTLVMDQWIDVTSVERALISDRVAACDGIQDPEPYDPALAYGDYDRADFRRLIEQREAIIQGCYEPLLAALEGDHWPEPGMGLLDAYVDLEDHWNFQFMPWALFYTSSNLWPPISAGDQLIDATSVERFHLSNRVAACQDLAEIEPYDPAMAH